VSQPGLVLVGFAVIGIAYVLLPVAAATYAWLHSPRRLRCPELDRDAVVVVDAAHAAWTSLVGPARRRVAGCSQWPGRERCRQRCLAGLPGTAPVSRVPA
jgi:hypothetical protein